MWKGCLNTNREGRSLQRDKAINNMPLRLLLPVPWSPPCQSCHMPALPAHWVRFLLRLHQEESGHAELCFLNWFHDRIESPDAEYHVTWYISWSPCFDCAEEVADFLREHENVRLSISAARLYQTEPEDKQGLQDLQEAGAQVAMMSPEGESRGSWGRAVEGTRTENCPGRVSGRGTWETEAGVMAPGREETRP